MGDTAPANQLRLSFTGSEDGEAETETCRAAKPLWRTTHRISGPQGLNSVNRRMRTRLSSGVGGASRRLLPLSRLRSNAQLSCRGGRFTFHLAGTGLLALSPTEGPVL